VAACGVASGVILVTLAGLIYRARPLLAIVNPGWTGAGIAVIAVSGFLVVGAALVWPRRLPGLLTGASAATLLALQFFVLSSASVEPVEEMAALVHQHRGANQPVGAYRTFVRNLVFYTRIRQVDLYSEDQAAAFLDRPEPILAVMNRADLARLDQGRPKPLHQLASVRYFNPAGLRLRMLLWPDPEGHVETVVLVTNRE
jgi:hypothetical protein